MDKLHEKIAREIFSYDEEGYKRYVGGGKNQMIKSIAICICPFNWSWGLEDRLSLHWFWIGPIGFGWWSKNVNIHEGKIK